MIISASTGQGFGGAISYVHKEKEKELKPEQRPEILQEQNVSGTTREQAQQMRFVANGNTRASRPVLHLSVNFSEKEKLTPEKIDQVLQDVIKEVGASPENNQYIIAKHNDAGHEHYHIVLNKVGFDGKNIDTSYIKNKCQVIANKLEQEHNLERVIGRTVVYDPKNNKGYRFTTKAERNQEQKKPKDRAVGVRDKKTGVQEKVGSALKESKSLADLKGKLQAYGIETKFIQNVNGLSGISFRYENQALKGSHIGYKAKDIRDILERNAGKKLERYEEAKRSILERTQPNQIDEVKKVEDLYQKIEVGQKIFKQILEIKRYTDNIIQQVKESAYKGERVYLKDGGNVTSIVDKAGKVYVQHQENPKIKFEIKGLGLIKSQEEKRGEIDRDYKQRLQEYNKLTRLQEKEIPPIWQVWKANERKEILDYNQNVQNMRHQAREPIQQAYIVSYNETICKEAILKAEKTVSLKINEMVHELKQSKAQNLNSFDKLNEQREQNLKQQEKKRNRGIRR